MRDVDINYRYCRPNDNKRSCILTGFGHFKLEILIGGRGRPLTSLDIMN